MKNISELKLSDLQQIGSNLRRAANQLGYVNASDYAIIAQVAPDATVDASTGEYLVAGAPSGLYAYYVTKPLTGSVVSTGGGSGTPAPTVNLGPINAQLAALRDADTKLARIEALTALSEQLEANKLLDEQQKAEIIRLQNDISEIRAADLKAQVEVLAQQFEQRIKDVEAKQQQAQTGSSIDEARIQEIINAALASMRLDISANNADIQRTMSNIQTIQSTLTEYDTRISAAHNSGEQAKALAWSYAADTRITKDEEEGYITVNMSRKTLFLNPAQNENQSDVLTQIRGAQAGMEVQIRCYNGMSIKHNNSSLRCKGAVDITGVNANSFITFKCLSPSGTGVWIETARNF